MRAVKVQYSQVKERRESFKTNTDLPMVTEVLQVTVVTERGSGVGGLSWLARYVAARYVAMSQIPGASRRMHVSLSASG